MDTRKTYWAAHLEAIRAEGIETATYARKHPPRAVYET